MRTRTAKRSISAVAAVLSLTVTACAAGGSDTAAPKPGGDKLTDFTFTSWNYGEEAQKELITAEVAGFTSGKGISAKFSSYPFAEYRNQLLLRSRSKEMDGAAQVDIADLKSLARLGVLADLGGYTSKDTYTEAALKNGQVDGKQLGLPWYTGSIGLVANDGLLKKAGVAAQPKTVSEFEAALVKVKALGGDYVPYAMTTKPETVKDFIPWLRTFGSKIVDGDKIAVNDKGAVEALTWIKGLLDQKLISLNTGRPEARTLYSQGRAAFFDDANQVRGTLAKQAVDKSIVEGTLPIPRPVVKEGDVPQSLAWGGVIVVFNHGPVQTSAEFAGFMTSDKDTVLRRYSKIGSAPATKTALADPAFAGDAFASTWQQASTVNAQPNPLWAFSKYGQMESVLATQIQAALIGNKSPQQALDAAAAEMQALAD
ncbi:MAG TPA: hypothetical protein VM677_00040 [Actinokineospora sp.]|nr:hypothetical protein [Actinokineospora sp.]